MKGVIIFKLKHFVSFDKECLVVFFNFTICVYTFSILILLVFTGSFIAQKDSRFNFNKIQSGPYFGIQQGRNIVVELGYERRNKEIQFKSPNTHAFDLGLTMITKQSLLELIWGIGFGQIELDLLSVHK
ncbi:MAG: hypothetical protein EBQ66_10975 [Flavobacteriia bacterium]|nr:hypothetical protein [Flavobacteriia bacterium]